MDSSSVSNSTATPELQLLDPGKIARFRFPIDIDLLAKEVHIVLQRCSVPEIMISAEERKRNLGLLVKFVQIFNGFANPPEGLSNRGLMARLFFTSLVTTDNIEALLRMTDASNITGYLRCAAISILETLAAALPCTWSLKLSDGTAFAGNLIQAFSKALHDEAQLKRDELGHCGCLCIDILWSILYDAVRITKETPTNTLRRIEEVNWRNIFRRRKTNWGYDIDVFIALHDIALRSFHVGPKKETAKNMLNKLGSCRELFRIYLKRIISGEVWKRCDGTVFDVLTQVSSFFLAFFHSLVAPPNEYETDALVRRTHSACLAKANAVRPTRTSEEKVLKKFNRVIKHYLEEENWEDFKNSTEEERTQDFLIFCSAKLSDKDRNKERLRQSRRETKINLRNCGDLDLCYENEMCMNCFKTEWDFENNRTFMKCSLCHQVSYCSRHCQRVHWKKGHSNACSANKNKNNNKNKHK